jgi:PmbA protein
VTVNKLIEYENLKSELLALVDTSLKYAGSVDSQAEFEIFLFYRNRAIANISQGIVDATDGVIEGNAARIAKKHQVSFASSSGISIDRIRRSINEATASLKSTSVKDERFQGFCEPQKPGEEGTFTEEILNMRKEDLISYSNSLIREGKGYDKRIHMAAASCEVEWGGFAIGNTRGLQEASRSALNSCEAYCIAVKGNERKTGYKYDISRERTIIPQGLGEKAAQKALSLLDAKKLDRTVTMPTIWTPDAAAPYLYASLGQSIRGEYVVEGCSPLAAKIGQEVAPNTLTVIDDGQNPAGFNTDAIDAEGFPQQTVILIERGKLQNFLFDTYYANIYGTQSSGSCSRPGRPFGSALPYETTPLIRPKNVEVKPGSKSLDEIISTVDKQAVLIVDMPIGIFHSDVATGEFSAVASSAFLIENGEKKWSLKPVSVAGSFYSGFEKLSDVGNDLEETQYTVTTPTLAFDGFSIVG